jgi:hypothetical protein
VAKRATLDKLVGWALTTARAANDDVRMNHRRLDITMPKIARTMNRPAETRRPVKRGA